MAQRIGLPERFEQSWRVWNEAIDGLQDADFDLPVYPHWTVKDIAGHVYSYMDLMRRHVKTYRKHKKLASPCAPSYGYFNRREAERLRPVPPAQLLAEMNDAFAELSALLPSLTPEDLRRIFPSQWSSSKGHNTLRGLLSEEARHISAHAGDIRKWRASRNVDRLRKRGTLE